ncbi:MAG: hypothetical protein ACXVCA_20110 [Bdellovibrio sp.]
MFQKTILFFAFLFSISFAQAASFKCKLNSNGASPGGPASFILKADVKTDYVAINDFIMKKTETTIDGFYLYSDENGFNKLLLNLETSPVVARIDENVNSHLAGSGIKLDYVCLAVK